MNCDLASRYLDAFVDGELEPGVESELEKHLRDCISCQSQTWEIREFRSLFRMYAPRFKAPAQLRARVLSMTYREQKKPAFNAVRYAWLGAAAVLTVGLLLGFLASAPDHGKELSKEAVFDYSGRTSF
jgi:anti-sigma factor RsiW